MTLLGRGARHVMVTLVALGAAVMVVGVAAALAQGGFFLATKSVKPSLKKLDPHPGLQAGLRPAGALGGRQDAASRAPSSASWPTARCSALMPLIGGLVPDLRGPRGRPRRGAVAGAQRGRWPAW